MSSTTPNPYGNPGGVALPAQGEAPLDQPLYGASFGQAIKRFFKKYATFSGRASRSEFWFFALFNAIVYTVLYGLAIGFGLAGSDPATGEMGAGGTLPTLLIGLYGLAIIIPSIALSVRRLHDGNFSGLLYLLILVPEYLLLVMLVGLLSGWLSNFTSLGQGAGPLGLLVVGIVGAALVIPTGGEIPVVVGLTAAGAGLGAAGVLLITLPALSVPSMVMVARTFGVRTTLTVAGWVIAGGLGAAALLTALV